MPNQEVPVRIVGIELIVGQRLHRDTFAVDTVRARYMHQSPRDSCGVPGTRAPHAWVELHGQRVSTIDLIGRNFVLLAGSAGEAWHDAAHAVSATTRLPLDVQRLGTGGLPDTSGAVADAFGITAAGASLVRPDGFVAWRSQAAWPPPGCAAILATALATATGQERPPS